MKNCITENHGLFSLHTEHTSYMFRIDRWGHPEHIHYGRRVEEADAEALSLKHTLPYGMSSEYTDEDPRSWRSTAPFEYTNCGIGDYRIPACEIRTSAGIVTDFRYEGFEIEDIPSPMECGFPSAYGADGELIIHLYDSVSSLQMDLHYAVYAHEDVITRRTVLRNRSAESAAIRRLMSYSVDLMEDHLKMVTFTGCWAHEAQRTDRPVRTGTLENSSNTGFSSNYANPGFLLCRSNTTEENGEAWGFNLIYSGSHKSLVSRDDHGCVRVMGGFNDESFCWHLSAGETFETPEAFMTYADGGLNMLSQRFHAFIMNHVVRGAWQFRERPVLVNDWEAFMFQFDEERLVSLARQGKELGAELFVLDDGWFGERNSDHAGLGDYTVNPAKLPHGIRGLSDRIHDLGMMFGLWFEPEAVNPDSDLYRAHPEWIIHEEGRRDLTGRYEYLLDLSRTDVQDYIIENVGRVLDEGNVDYVKWDMNRSMTAADGTLAYRYMQGLYRVLGEIFYKRPQILLESCSSGGNRFDAGMLCYSPQVWTSDDTDPVERLDIQKGTSYLYPQSTMGAHVSACPHGQTLRDTPLPTRFAVSAFGVLGYELDLTILTDAEKEEIRNQIAWYKENRRLLQFGTFSRGITDDVHERFSVSCGSEAVSGVFRRLVRAASAFEKMKTCGLEEGRYEVCGRRALLPVRTDHPFLPAAGKNAVRFADGSAALQMKEMKVSASAGALAQGICLPMVFNASGFHPEMRLPQDLGAELYTIRKAG